MNKRNSSIFLLLSALALASCGGQGTSSSSQPDISTWTDVARDIYSVAAFKLNEDLEASKIATETFKVNPAMPHILYCDFQTYFRCLLPSFSEDTTMEVTKDRAIIRVKGQNAFIGSVDTEKDRFSSIGFVGSGYPMPTDSSKSSLYLGASFQSTSTANKEEYISYADYALEIPVIETKDAFYAPISLFDLAFQSAFSLYHFDNFENLYQISSASDLEIPLDDEKTLITDNLAKYYAENGKKMPADLLALERATFYTAFDHRYGLAHNRNIKKMSDYFKTLGYDQDMLDPDKSFIALGSFIAGLNDGHTGLSGIASHWGDTAEAVPTSRFRYNMLMLRSSLQAARLDLYRKYGGNPNSSVLYSDSGETAFVSFDSFTYTYDTFEEDGKTPVVDLWLKDSFFYLAHQFKAIKAKGGVKRIIIDDSANGGGNVGVAMKILSLISKENRSRFYLYDWRKGTLHTYITKVDTNLDGTYDLNDVYGDDFEFAILASPFSFSCGNALPYYAKRHGHAKILGLTTGGGECAVGEMLLPSGRQLRHSSNTLIVDYDSTTHTVITNAEAGASPDYAVSLGSFYDINFLEQTLKG